MRRRRPSPVGGQVVAVTGAASGLGRALLERLARRADLGGLIGIDTSPGSVDGVVWRVGDVRNPLLARRLAGVTTVVHLAAASDAGDPDARRALNVRGTSVVLDAAQTAGVGRVVLVTSADVYGHRADNPVPLPSDASPGAPAGDDLVGDHVAVEALAAAAGVPVAILRPATLIGGGLGAAYDGALLRQLSAPRLLAARGTEPLWQLCHSDDLLRALEVVVVAGLTGPLPVASDGALRQSVVEELAGRRRVELPASVALSTAERLHRLGVSTAAPRELDHLLGPVVVGTERLRAAGWTPAWTNEAALQAHLLSRAKAGGHAGAYTAAGATVAVLGTAALMRQARRRRRGP